MISFLSFALYQWTVLQPDILLPENKIQRVVEIISVIYRLRKCQTTVDIKDEQ